MEQDGEQQTPISQCLFCLSQASCGGGNAKNAVDFYLWVGWRRRGEWGSGGELGGQSPAEMGNYETQSERSFAALVFQ